jgi:hypothetical protein
MKNRPERLISFLVVWFTMFSCICVRGQKSPSEGLVKDFAQLRYPGTGVDPIDRKSPLPGKDGGESYNPSPFFGLNMYNGMTEGSWEVLYAQPSNLYYMQSGFICKREWELEKATHIPFRFRIGSLADCDALEGRH